jgi:hypothetical protein
MMAVLSHHGAGPASPDQEPQRALDQTVSEG